MLEIYKEIIPVKKVVPFFMNKFNITTFQAQIFVDYIFDRLDTNKNGTLDFQVKAFLSKITANFQIHPFTDTNTD